MEKEGGEPGMYNLSLKKYMTGEVRNEKENEDKDKTHKKNYGSRSSLHSGGSGGGGVPGLHYFSVDEGIKMEEDRLKRK
jgi:hypothetical protein